MRQGWHREDCPTQPAWGWTSIGLLSIWICIVTEVHDIRLKTAIQRFRAGFDAGTACSIHGSAHAVSGSLVMTLRVPQVENSKVRIDTSTWIAELCFSMPATAENSMSPQTLSSCANLPASPIAAHERARSLESCRAAAGERRLALPEYHPAPPYAIKCVRVYT